MASCPCSASSQPSSVISSIVRRSASATAWARSSAPIRPVMLATSTRQPSRPVAQPVRRDRVGTGVEPTGQLGRGVVELGQARDVEPRGVAVLLGVGEPVERPLGRGRVLLRPHEPVVVLAGVVGGEVADQSQAVGVDGVGQPLQRLVAAEERVHPVEGHRVVAVGGPRLEDGRQVEQRRAQVVEVVEVLGDAVERAAVPLERHVGALVHDRLVPLAGDGPVGDGRAGLGPAEAVGEDLVADLVGHPRGQPVVGADEEVTAVGDVARVHAGGGEPAEVGGTGRDEEAVGRHPVDDAQPDLPPRAGRVLRDLLGTADRRLAVAHRAQHDLGRARRAVGGVRDPHAQRDHVAQRRTVVRDVVRRAVVVGVEGMGLCRHA